MLGLWDFSVYRRDYRFRGSLALVGMMDWTRVRKALIWGWVQWALS